MKKYNYPKLKSEELLSEWERPPGPSKEFKEQYFKNHGVEYEEDQAHWWHTGMKLSERRKALDRQYIRMIVDLLGEKR